MNHRAQASAAALLACLAASDAARADHRPAIAVPGNPQVPVVIDGQPASGALVTGDWGLYAPGRVPPEIIGPVYAPIEHERGYFPRTGRRPRYGRQEVFVPRRRGPPARMRSRSSARVLPPGEGSPRRLS